MLSLRGFLPQVSADIRPLRGDTSKTQGDTRRSEGLRMENILRSHPSGAGCRGTCALIATQRAGWQPALSAEAPQLEHILSDVCSALRLRDGFRFNPGGAGVGRG